MLSTLTNKIKGWVTFGIKWITGRQKYTLGVDAAAQTAHFFAGAFFIFAASVFHIGLLAGWIALMAWTFYKEAYMDPLEEGDPYFFNGLKDQEFYVLGALLASAFILV